MLQLIIAELGQLVVGLGRTDAVLVHRARYLGRVVECLVSSGTRGERNTACVSVFGECHISEQKTMQTFL
jgi:hypothetical protein